MEPAVAAALFAARADAPRKRPGPRLPDAARRGEQGSARVPARHLSVGLWRGVGALFRNAGRRTGHVRNPVRTVRVAVFTGVARSEESRVGKGCVRTCRYRGGP